MSRMRDDAQKKKMFGLANAALALYRHGYRVERIIEANLNYIIYQKASSFLVCRSALKKFVVIPGFHKLRNIEAATLFTFPEWTDRKDYTEILDYASAGVKNKCIVPLSALPLKPAFHFKNLLLAIKTTRRLTGFSFLQRFYLTACMYNALLMIDDAERNINVQIRKYVSFSCVMVFENLLTQYFMKRGIPTYNLQHGTTHLYEKNLGDEIEYRNMITDHHLAWGDYTRNELIKYGMNPNHIYTAGYPRKVLLKKLKAPLYKKCMVFLSRIKFQQANTELLAILAEFNRVQPKKFQFSFKLHPSLDTNELKKIINTRYPDSGFHVLTENTSLQEIFEQERIDFCIAVNSTTYYECYIHGVPALRFKTDDFDMSHPLTMDTFETKEEFSQLITNLYQDFETFFDSEKIGKELDYVLGLHKNEYVRLLS